MLSIELIIDQLALNYRFALFPSQIYSTYVRTYVRSRSICNVDMDVKLIKCHQTSVKTLK